MDEVLNNPCHVQMSTVGLIWHHKPSKTAQNAAGSPKWSLEVNLQEREKLCEVSSACPLCSQRIPKHHFCSQNPIWDVISILLVTFGGISSSPPPPQCPLSLSCSIHPLGNSSPCQCVGSCCSGASSHPFQSSSCLASSPQQELMGFGLVFSSPKDKFL